VFGDFCAVMVVTEFSDLRLEKSFGVSENGSRCRDFLLHKSITFTEACLVLLVKSVKTM